MNFELLSKEKKLFLLCCLFVVFVLLCWINLFVSRWVHSVLFRSCVYLVLIISKGIKNVLTSKVEHHAVLHPVEQWRDRGTITLDFVNLDERKVLVVESHRVVSRMHLLIHSVGLMVVSQQEGFQLRVSCSAVKARWSQKTDYLKTIHYLWMEAHLFELELDVRYCDRNH